MSIAFIVMKTLCDPTEATATRSRRNDFRTFCGSLISPGLHISRLTCWNCASHQSCDQRESLTSCSWVRGFNLYTPVAACRISYEVVVVVRAYDTLYILAVAFRRENAPIRLDQIHAEGITLPVEAHHHRSFGHLPSAQNSCCGLNVTELPCKSQRRSGCLRDPVLHLHRVESCDHQSPGQSYG